MDKANIIKALEICGHIANSHVRGISACEGCPYIGMDNCDEQMCADAAAMLKANEAPKANEPIKPKYTHIEVYTKKGNLLGYFENNPNICCSSTEEYNKKLAYYAKEREIQLIALFRYEKGKTFCKIKCPVNPMPTNKEFEAASMAAVYRFLNANGWTWKQDFNARMFE